MILVDIYVPAVDDTFDFMLDENTEIGKVVMEIVEMLSKKMQGAHQEVAEEFLLCHMGSRKILEQDRTLHMSGVSDGSRLMLV